MPERGIFGILNVMGILRRVEMTGEVGKDGGKSKCSACGGRGVVGILKTGSGVEIGSRVEGQIVRCPVCGQGGKREKGDSIVFYKAAEAG